MSHGSELKNEPNMTPMLDMVLQLVMFFMLVANFVMDEANVAVILPKATTAVALDKNEDDLLYLNVDEKGALLPTDGDRQPLAAPNSIQQYLIRRYRTKVESAGDPEEGKRNAKKMLIIIRAHEDARFQSVLTVLKSCKIAGFERLQLRVKKV